MLISFYIYRYTHTYLNLLCKYIHCIRTYTVQRLVLHICDMCVSKYWQGFLIKLVYDHFLTISDYKNYLYVKLFDLISYLLVSVSSVAQLCPTLCDPMNRSTPGLPVHHQLLEFTQTHVHWVSDTIQPSYPLSSPSPPAFNLSSIRVFSKESVLCIRWPKYWSFSNSLSNEQSGLISFRMGWFDLLAVQGTLMSLLQHHSSKASLSHHKWNKKHIVIYRKYKSNDLTLNDETQMLLLNGWNVKHINNDHVPRWLTCHQ